MKGRLRLVGLSLLIVRDSGALFYLYNKWKWVEKKGVASMRSSNKDCGEEFRCICKTERVIEGNETAAVASSLCYLLKRKEGIAS